MSVGPTDEGPRQYDTFRIKGKIRPRTPPDRMRYGKLILRMYWDAGNEHSGRDEEVRIRSVFTPPKGGPRYSSRTGLRIRHHV